MRILVRVILFLSIYINSSFIYANEFSTSEDEHILKSSQALKDEWYKQKKNYRDKFEKNADQLGAEIKKLENALDGGHPERRNKINEILFDLRREFNDIKQILDEITASTAVKWMHIQGDLKDTVEDIKD